MVHFALFCTFYCLWHGTTVKKLLYLKHFLKLTYTCLILDHTTIFFIQIIYCAFILHFILFSFEVSVHCTWKNFLHLK